MSGNTNPNQLNIPNIELGFNSLSLESKYQLGKVTPILVNSGYIDFAIGGADKTFFLRSSFPQLDRDGYDLLLTGIKLVAYDNSIGADIASVIGWLMYLEDTATTEDIFPNWLNYNIDSPDKINATGNFDTSGQVAEFSNFNNVTTGQNFNHRLVTADILVQHTLSAGVRDRAWFGVFGMFVPSSL